MKPTFNPIQKADDLWEDGRPTKTGLLDEALGDLRNAIAAVKETAAQETALSDKDVRHILNAYLSQAYVTIHVVNGEIVFNILIEDIYEDTLEGKLKTITEDWFEIVMPADDSTIADDLHAWRTFHEWLGSQLKKHDPA